MDTGTSDAGGLFLLGFCCLLVIAVVGVIVTLVNLNSRKQAERDRERQRWAASFGNAPPDSSWRKRPAPGDIWQVWVPHHDMPGDGKWRPALVIRTYWNQIEVLKSTGQDKSGDNRYLEILNTRGWDRRRDRNSYLYLNEVYTVDDGGLDRRRGRCDPSVWARVQSTHYPTGWYHGE
ncbi:hypothetical protein AB0I28_00725 [Phytomonospora sp. NPDC050363]|uniref:hypothetical protein n=1 Tax=Phytomonospora sp. NPDC050363 TaxID=3155642 RepID=UPI0033E394E6